MGADGHHAGAALRCQQRADRETAAQRFRGGKHVRRHAVVHIGVQLPGTADAGLDFVENQQRVVRIAQFTQAAQEVRIRRHDAAFTLHRFNDHRAGIVVDQRLCRVEVVIDGVLNLRRQRRKILRIGRLAASGNGKQRAAVEGILERHDAAFLTAETIVGIFTRQF